MKAYQMAIELDKDYVAPGFNLGKLYLRCGKLAEAENILGRLCRLNPRVDEIQRQLVLVFLFQGNYVAAARQIANSVRTFIHEQRPFLHDPVARGHMDRKAARKALLDLKKTLYKESISFFLRSGTLLGCIREGEFLEHDKDIDLGVFEEPDRDTLLQLLQGTSLFQQISDDFPDLNKVSFSVRHVNGTFFDIYHYQDKGDHYLAECYQPGQSFGKRFTKFSLAPADFIGTTFQIPDNPALYLSELYGNDWQTPMPFFDSMVSSRNLEPGTEIISKCIAYGRLGGALQRSENDRAEYYCQQLIEKFPCDEIALEAQAYLNSQ